MSNSYKQLSPEELTAIQKSVADILQSMTDNLRDQRMIAKMGQKRALEIREKLVWLDENIPDWRSQCHENGTPIYSLDGTLLNPEGDRSIFDDIDEDGSWL